ncbi:unnamed protein product, partial [Tenebrio molitor]
VSTHRSHTGVKLGAKQLNISGYMVLLYGECKQNATAAAEEYAARFPNRRRPNPHVILRLISRARHTGVAGAPRTARVHAMEEAVLE